MISAQSPHIVTVVLNSISHDARVLKEADALAAAGYRVTIVGIKDNNCDEDLTLYSSGVRAVRVECRDNLASIINTGHKIWRYLHLPLAIITGAVFFAYLPSLIRQSREWLVADSMNQRIALVAIGVIVGLVIDRLACRYIRNRSPAGTYRVGFGNRVVRVSKIRIKQWVHQTTLTTVVQELAPDAIHLHDVTSLPVGLLYRKRGGTAKLIFDSHELYEAIPNATWWHKRTTRSLQNRIAPLLSGFITINESIASKLMTLHPKLPDPVIVKNAAKLPETPAIDDGRLREAAAIRPGVRILLYQGGYANNRGLQTLIEAAPLLPADWVLVMMGWGRLEETLRSKAALLDPEGERIRFIGRAPQDELVYWTAGADLGIIPYVNIGLNHWFCTPNKLWEYPASGVPVLASPFPELRRIVEGEDIGVLLDDPLTPRGIADVVAGLSNDDLNCFKAQCRSFIIRDNWSVYAERLVNLYDGILNPVSGRSSPEESRPERSVVQAGSLS